MSAPPGVHWPRAWAVALRLVLAHIRGDEDATDVATAEVGSCGHCWQLVARCAVHLAANGWTRAGETDTVAELLCNGIMSTLDRLEAQASDFDYGGSM